MYAVNLNEAKCVKKVQQIEVLRLRYIIEIKPFWNSVCQRIKKNDSVISYWISFVALLHSVYFVMIAYDMLWYTSWLVDSLLFLLVPHTN